jgi:hypothetical protein
MWLDERHLHVEASDGSGTVVTLRERLEIGSDGVNRIVSNIPYDLEFFLTDSNFEKQPHRLAEQEKNKPHRKTKKKRKKPSSS